MNLATLLAKTLKTWPGDDAIAYQDADKEVRFESLSIDSDNYVKYDFFPEDLADKSDAYSHNGIPFAGPVTREEWEAARLALPQTIEIERDLLRQIDESLSQYVESFDPIRLKIDKLLKGDK